VLLLRGFDGSSREKAAELRRLLRAAVAFGDVEVRTEPAPLVAVPDRLDQHYCVIIDVVGP
jgi:hypothetical protein